MKALSIIALGLLLPLLVSAQPQREAVTNAAKERMSFAPNGTEIAIALIYGDEVDFIGMNRVKDTWEDCRNDTRVFEIGSISKVFTGILLANHVLSSQVQLDDPINNYLDIPIKDSIQITFKQLSNHSSGLPRMPSNFMKSSIRSPLNPFQFYDEELLLEYLTDKMKLEFEPATNYQYSNLGAGLLGYLMTQISETSYQKLLDSLIVSKYGMDHTSSIRADLEDNMAPGLNAGGKETPNWDLNVLVGAGGILSTAQDLVYFAQAQFNRDHKDLLLAQQKTFVRENQADLALGWHIIKADGREFHFHNGGTGGYSTSMAIDLDRKTAFIILTNISAFHKQSQDVTKLCLDLVKTL